jgi:hypothetical protein
MSFTIKRTQPKSLCNTCSHVHQMKGMRLGEEKTLCSNLPAQHALITFPVEECSEYSEKNKQNLYEMQKIAWVIEQKKGSFVGFHDPDTAKKKGIKNDLHDY